MSPKNNDTLSQPAMAAASPSYTSFIFNVAKGLSENALARSPFLTKVSAPLSPYVQRAIELAGPYAGAIDNNISLACTSAHNLQESGKARLEKALTTSRALRDQVVVRSLALRDQGLKLAKETTQQGLKLAQETTQQGLKLAQETTQQGLVLASQTVDRVLPCAEVEEDIEEASIAGLRKRVSRRISKRASQYNEAVRAHFAQRMSRFQQMSGETVSVIAKANPNLVAAAEKIVARIQSSTQQHISPQVDAARKRLEAAVASVQLALQATRARVVAESNRNLVPLAAELRARLDGVQTRVVAPLSSLLRQKLAEAYALAQQKQRDVVILSQSAGATALQRVAVPAFHQLSASALALVSTLAPYLQNLSAANVRALLDQLPKTSVSFSVALGNHSFFVFGQQQQQRLAKQADVEEVVASEAASVAL
jgi:hypothetical protein